MAVHADIGDNAAGADDFLTELKGRRNPDRLNRRVDAAPARQLLHRRGGLSVPAVDRLGRPKLLCGRQP